MKKSTSPPAHKTDSTVKLNKPIIAKDNFVLAHKNLIPGVKNLLKQQQDEEIMTGKCKEVEEWLMGSGESSETAASLGLKGSLSFKLVQGDKKTETIIEDPIQEEKEDEWMFRTFSKKQKSPTTTSSNNEV